MVVRPHIWEMSIRAVVFPDKTSIEVRQSQFGPAPEPIVVEGAMTKRDVLSYIVVCDTLGI